MLHYENPEKNQEPPEPQFPICTVEVSPILVAGHAGMERGCCSAEKLDEVGLDER